MSRIYCGLLFGTWIVLVAAKATGRVTVDENWEGNNRVTIYRITAAPAPQPTPALKYRLLPSDLELRPGNAASLYYRAVLESGPLITQLRKEYGDDLDQWRTMSDEEIPLDKARDAVARFDATLLPTLHTATHRETCDWGLQLRDVSGLDVIAIRLPEFQESRELSRLLALKVRLAVAAGDFLAAAEAMQINYRLAQDVARPPLLVAGLIGMAEAQIMHRQIVEWIGREESPNLYWALAALPQPLIELRPALQYEVNFGMRIFPWLADAEQTDRSPEAWRRLLGREMQDTFNSLTSGTSLPPEMSRPWKEALSQMGVAAIGLKHYPTAKRQVIASGMASERVEAMPVAQVLAIVAARNYRYVADEYEKWWYLPYWEAKERITATGKRLFEEGYLGNPAAGREIFPVASLLLPAVGAARHAEARSVRDVAVLQTIEAIRMHAAANDGRPPARLSEITLVPVPSNPFTGEPFLYRAEGNRAVIELPATAAPYAIARYELTLIQNKEPVDE